jgi:hypothetical protein
LGFTSRTILPHNAPSLSDQSHAGHQGFTAQCVIHSELIQQRVSDSQPSEQSERGRRCLVAWAHSQRAQIFFVPPLLFMERDGRRSTTSTSTTSTPGPHARVSAPPGAGSAWPTCPLGRPTRQRLARRAHRPRPERQEGRPPPSVPPRARDGDGGDGWRWRMRRGGISSRRERFRLGVRSGLRTGRDPDPEAFRTVRRQVARPRREARPPCAATWHDRPCCCFFFSSASASSLPPVRAHAKFFIFNNIFYTFAKK